MNNGNKTKCNCSQLRSRKMTMEEFEEWRDEFVDNTSERCMEIEIADNTEELDNDFITNLPKCIIALTKKMCECDQKCITTSLMKTNFSKKCFLYDLDNLYFDTEYKNCSFIDESIPNFNLNVGRNKFRLHDSILSLCNDAKDVNSVLCLAYDLRNACRNEVKCMEPMEIIFSGMECKNQNFKNQIEEIGKTLKYNFLKSGHDYKKRVNRDIKYHELSSDYNSRNYTNNSDIQLAYSDTVNTKCLTFAIPIIAISLLISFISGVFMIRKENSLVVGVPIILLSSGIAFMSFYSI